ncbi:LysR family transcriptional regulator [Variovorax saccharolyticus]|uniref:LysR family transcriptional regulator n=1 Tax=Variovorax saccharolyticus TaxID=3053516 RepID=UPI002575DAD6|nr:LysR family transcriptional regulator [Variovorax sp. J31P216]MDM0026158.1 LysR family transcriptional regulator [Variovorax sp. J31P216]
MASDRPYARLRFSQLEMISEIAETGGVRTAAERLHLSAAAVSKSLREIERSLGFALFERRPRGMAATVKGERVVAHARLLLNEIGYMADDSEVARPRQGGLIRVGASPYVIAHVLPGLLSRLHAAQAADSRMTVRIHEGHLGAMIELLLAGQIDALVTLYAMGDLAGTNTDAVAIEKLRDEPIVVVAPPALHPGGRRKVRWSELADMPWILPAASTHMRRAVETMFHMDSTMPPLPVIEGTNLQGNVSLSVAGLGITIAPMTLARAPLEAGTLRLVNVREAMPSSALALVYRRISAMYRLGVEELRAAAHAAFA